MSVSGIHQQYILQTIFECLTTHRHHLHSTLVIIHQTSQNYRNYSNSLNCIQVPLENYQRSTVIYRYLVMWYDFWFARYYFIEIDCGVSRAEKHQHFLSFFDSIYLSTAWWSESYLLILKMHFWCILYFLAVTSSHLTLFILSEL